MKLAILLLLFIAGCQNNLANHSNEKSKIAHEIMEKTFTKLEKEMELHPFGTGAQMMDEVKMLALTFNYYQKIEINEGRKLLIIALDTFLNAINADNRILPYLEPCPFKPQNIQICIVLRNRDGSSVASEKLCFLSVKKGKLRYDIKDPQTNRLKTIYEETYEEAVEKLHQQPEEKSA